MRITRIDIESTCGHTRMSLDCETGKPIIRVSGYGGTGGTATTIFPYPGGSVVIRINVFGMSAGTGEAFQDVVWLFVSTVGYSVVEGPKTDLYGAPRTRTYAAGGSGVTVVLGGAAGTDYHLTHESKTARYE